MRYCTAGIGTKLLFYSNCDILGEGDRGGIRGLGKVCVSVFVFPGKSDT